MCDCKQIDLTPLAPVLDAAQNGSGNLIAILQKTQDVLFFYDVSQIKTIGEIQLSFVT